MSDTRLAEMDYIPQIPTRTAQAAQGHIDVTADFWQLPVDLSSVIVTEWDAGQARLGDAEFLIYG